eukprot:2256591-Pyramimonas_sp.AAC.1
MVQNTPPCHSAFPMCQPPGNEISPNTQEAHLPHAESAMCYIIDRTGLKPRRPLVPDEGHCLTPS